MKPTAQQITTASRLQELGVGQDSREWIIELKNGSFEFYDGNLGGVKFDPERGKYENCKKITGPLPNAAECWPEIEKLLDGTNRQLCVRPEGSLEIEDWNLGKVRWSTVDPFTDLDEAFRQALITLAAQ